jgi:glycosyltransferase involved in cell wall biosynthesis
LHRPHLDTGGFPQMPGKLTYVTSSLRRTPREIAQVARLCREEGIDVTHTHMSSAHAYGAILRLFYGVPAVATAHKLNIQLHWAFNDTVVCHNEESVQFHRRWNLVPPSKLRIVPAFVDEGDLLGIAVDRSQVRRAFGLPEDALLLTTVGHVTPRKGAIDVVSALGRLTSRHPNLMLAIAGWSGDPHYKTQILARATEFAVEHHLVWLQRLSDPELLQLLKASDCCVQASHVETGPLVVLEAMALGLPVVGTRCGSMPEFIAPGLTGELVAPGDAAGLAQALDTVLADPGRRQAMGAAGRARFLAGFSAEVNIPKIEALLAEAARRRPLRGAPLSL